LYLGFIRVEMVIEGGDIDRHVYEMIAAKSAASFDIIEELRWRGDELLNKNPVKDQIRPEVAVVQDDGIP
jgi:hypothetical protein